MADEYDIDEINSEDDSVNSDSDVENVPKKTNKKFINVGEREDIDDEDDLISDLDEEDEDEPEEDDLEDEENPANMEMLLASNIIGGPDDNRFGKATTNSNNVDMDDEDEDDDEDANDYLQKIDESHKEKIIENYHPELKALNYEEIDTLCTIIKDAQGNIIDSLHKTSPFLSRYEKARILGERADQLNSGAQPFIEVEANIIDGYLIALKELEQKKIPFIIQRPLPNGVSEYWRLVDLEQIS